jgi:RNA polymerase sigma factor (TIGR02999 family)
METGGGGYAILAGANRLSDPGEITLLLSRWNSGNEDAVGPLFELVYPQLRQIAGQLFRNERYSPLLQPTGVVNELYLKLIQQDRLKLEDRQHFFSLCALLMRRLLVDQARSEGRKKRDGGTPVPLHESLAWIHAAGVELVDLDQALDELRAIDDRKCRMVELRCFLGFTSQETANLLGASKATVDRDLKFVRAWLQHRLISAQP